MLLKSKELTDALKSLVEGNELVAMQILRGDVNGQHPYGFFYGVFEDEDPRLTDVIFSFIGEESSNAQFQEDICKLFHNELETEIEGSLAKAHEASLNGKDDYISRTKAECDKMVLQDLNFENLRSYYGDVYDSYGHYGASSLGDFKSKSEYLSFKVAELIFNYAVSRQNERFPAKDGSKLEAYYEGKGICLKDIDVQYRKYGLLSLGGRFSLSISDSPKLKDSVLNSHLFLRHYKLDVLGLLEQMMGSGWIRNLSLLPDYTIAGDGIQDNSFAMEELEYGKNFSLGSLGAIPLTKLYDLDRPEDTLWVKVGNSEITFEELLDDFDVDGDSVVTQVVHLEYIKDGEEIFIQHLDHEFIFYTESEYELRLKNGYQKGGAMTRIKTFKVDDSRIPLYLDDDSFFLYTVLSEYFKKTDLLAEYFETVV